MQQAFREVHDAPMTTARMREHPQARQVQTLHRNAGPSRARYEGGYSSDRKVLDSERGLFGGQRAEAQARGDVVNTLASAYRAFGVGWGLRAEQMADALSHGAAPEPDKEVSQ